MKMYPDDWRVRLTTAVIPMACFGAAMIFVPMVGIHGFWPGILAAVVSILIGNVLAQIVYRRLFRPPSGPTPNHRPDA